MVGDVPVDQVCVNYMGVVVLLTRTGTVQRCGLLILYTQSSSGPRWFSIAAVIQLPGRQTGTAPKTHNNQTELEISSHSAVLSAV